MFGRNLQHKKPRIININIRFVLQVPSVIDILLLLCLGLVYFVRTKSWILEKLLLPIYFLATYLDMSGQ